MSFWITVFCVMSFIKIYTLYHYIHKRNHRVISSSRSSPKSLMVLKCLHYPSLLQNSIDVILYYISVETKGDTVIVPISTTRILKNRSKLYLSFSYKVNLQSLVFLH